MAESAGELQQEVSPKPLWPVVIGTVSMALAVRELLDFVVRAANWYVVTQEYGLSVSIGNTVLVCTNVILAIFLLGAGYRLARRRKHHLHIVYALVYVGFVAIGIWHYRNHIRTLAWLVTALVYPMFLLIWFSRPRIRRQVAQW